MTAALAAILLLQTPTSLFDATASAHTRLKTISARVESSGSSQNQTARSTTWVTQTANSLILRVQEPAKPGFDRTDRVFRVSGKQFDAYDAIANERLARPVDADEPLAARMSFALGGLEEAAAVLIEPQRLKKLFDGLRVAPGWKVSRGPGVIKITRSGVAKGLNLSEGRIVIGASDRLLREVLLKSGKNVLNWKFSYGAPVAFAPPADARRVSSFTVAETPPSFGSRDAKAAYQGMLKAAGALRSGTVIVRTDSETSRIAFEGRRVREGDRDFVWVFDGSQLAVYNIKAKRFYRGRAIRPNVIDLVTKLGGQLDGFTRSILLRRVPFKEVAAPGARISEGGSISVGGSSSRILRINSKGRRASLEINGKLRLPTSISVDHLDLNGKKVFGTARTLEYLQLNQKQPAEEFRLTPPKGMTVRPLPKIEILGG